MKRHATLVTMFVHGECKQLIYVYLENGVISVRFWIVERFGPMLVSDTLGARTCQKLKQALFAVRYA